ncbi:unnamed protein product [Blepharisma stoltei]|uniref:Uncharacterized protein n=1 Tax=Blepharisma stoltei TaxID=1481888 RepID=A0AAU9JUP8_9CILI|nr:unnamed protein product [Blepharisma stoltei]
MLQDFSNPPQQGRNNRDERWEARRKAKLGLDSASIPSSVVPPQPLSLQQDSFMNFPPPKEFPQNSQQFQAPPDPQYAPINEPPSYNPQGYDYPSPLPPMQAQVRQSFDQFQSPQQNASRNQPPPGNSFFTNPISEADERRRKVQEEYRAQVQYDIANKSRRQDDYSQEGYIPSQKNRPHSRSQIPMMQITEQQQMEIDRKKQYQMELQRQMQERETQKKRNRGGGGDEKQADYFPFGKPGAGAPFRDSSGNIIAVRPPKYNENDPKFLKPVDFYTKLGATGTDPSQRGQMQVSASQAQLMTDPYYQNSRAPYQDQYYDPRSGMPPPGDYYQEPMYQPKFPPPQSYSPMASQVPSMPPDYPPQGMPFQQVPPPPMYPPPQPIDIPQPNPTIPIMVESQVEYEKLAEKGKKIELGRALQEQMEERRRKKEEERRQKILEERLEEERLEKQRRELEMEFLREGEKKKKQLQDLEKFNAMNAQNIVVAAPPKRERRVRTPIDMPPVEPPRSPPKSPPIRKEEIRIERVTNEVPIEVTKHLQSQMDNEIWKIRNEMGHQQNELKDAIVKLKGEAQLANEQRYAAQRDLDRMREEMKQRHLDEEIRQKELYMAIVNNRLPKPDTNTRLPPYQPLPLNPPIGKGDASLSLDYAARSLNSDSKFIPLANPDIKFPTKPNIPPAGSQPDNIKALKLDTLFPSLPEGGPANISMDAFQTANSSLGLDYINKKNEERLSALDKIESGASDELNKLDDLLFKYLENDTKPASRASKLPSRGFKLDSIQEDFNEASLSLPRSQNSQGSMKYGLNESSVY